MNELSDQQLLRDYAEHHSEAAFGELVRRHIDLVYSVALRMVCETHSAEDVTQAVFMALAQDAARLNKHPVLSGWLHCTARNLAAKSVRASVRRQVREQEATAMNQLLSAATEAPWEHIAPHLDAALGELSEPERDAVLLRYFEQKSAPEIAGILGISDEAAQKRVSRAVEQLREFFTRRGVTLGTGGLVTLISANADQSAPSGLATATSAAALAGAGTSSFSAIAATKIIAMTTLQKALITATVFILAGAGIYEAHQAAQLRKQVNTFQQPQAPLAEQMQQLQRERDDAKNQLAAIRQEKERLPDNTAELLRLRGMAGVARRAIGEAEQLRAQLARQTSEATNNPVTGAMADAMKQGVEQQMEGRLSRMTASLHLTAEEARAGRDILMRQGRAMLAGMQQAISGEYDKAELIRLRKETGNTDEQIKALLTPDQQASFPAYQQEEAAHNASLAANSELLQMQSTLGLTAEQMDRVYAALYEVSFSQLTGSTTPPSTNQRADGDPVAQEAESMQLAMDQKAKALESVLTATQLDNYRQQQALQAKLVKDMMNKMKGAGGPK